MSLPFPSLPLIKPSLKPFIPGQPESSISTPSIPIMLQAIPYQTCPTPSPTTRATKQSFTVLKKPPKCEEILERVKEMVTENSVTVFGRRGCCMCHVMKQLLLLLGVNPAVCEVDEEDEVGVVDELATIRRGRGKNSRPQFPSVYVGGVLFGDLERLMAAHISGELIPVLKQAGAL